MDLSKREKHLLVSLVHRQIVDLERRVTSLSYMKDTSYAKELLGSAKDELMEYKILYEMLHDNRS